MRKRLRELGINVGILPTGPRNMITDVPGVKVGHVTLKQDLPNDEKVCTGVTAILPHCGNIFKDKVLAASFVLNGFGKTVGLIQIDELGEIESPIMLTNTFNVGNVWQGALQYMLRENPEIGDSTGSINIVVGECNDMFLNSARIAKISPELAEQAIENANTFVEEGGVGAGTGMTCFQYKGGIGTASRVVNSYTIGVLVVSNFGKREELQLIKSKAISPIDVPDGSIMIVVATNAPLTDRQLKRLAKRATVGLARTGSQVHHGSGDIIIAFSNGYTISHFDEGIHKFSAIRDDSKIMMDLFVGVAEATEEAIYNSLTMAETTEGRLGRIVDALPYDLITNVK
jgi:D-aminopeptidase